MNELCNIIRTARKEKRINAKDVAEMVGITPIYLCRIEKGYNIPSFEILQKICKVLDIDFIKTAKIAGYSKKINSAINTLSIKANNEEINLELGEKDFNLVLSLVKHLSNLTGEEKDIIEFIISHKGNTLT